ncbi:MAG: toll/interleukin-1 receptor domain-containing protein [Acidobacteriota bacterium]
MTEATAETVTEAVSDAYLTYAEDDREWVEQCLVPRLEAAGRRLRRDEDLPVGGFEVEERSRAVADARKTLVVVSDAYLANRWSLLEEAVTVELDPAARKRRLIPLLRGDARLPLRIRPLVAVDLRDDGNERQWQRLLDALDPGRDDAPPGFAQRWSLALEEATREMVEPTWHRAGAILLLLGYAVAMAAVSLVFLLLWDVPALRNAVSAALTASVHVLAALVWREDRDLFRRWSHLVARSTAWRAAMMLATATVGVAWTTHGVPEARRHLCGPFGCKEAGTIRLAIDAFDERGADAQISGVYEDVMMKLSEVPGIDVRSLAGPVLGDRALDRLGVDVRLTGRLDASQLTASLWDAAHQPMPPQVVVPAAAGGAADRMRLANASTRALLERLGVAPTPALIEALTQIPTDDPEAVAHNAEGFGLLREGRHEDAYAAFRAALDRDPDYSVAWSNLGEAAWRLGAYEQALDHRRRAVECLPSHAIFHHNLGHALAQLGRDDEALASLQEALARDPALISAYNESANVLLALDRPAEAVDALRRALLLAPDFAPASKNLGRAFLAAGDAQDADAPLAHALAHYPPTDLAGRNEAMALRVEVAVAQGDEAAACRHLHVLRDGDPVGVLPFTPAAESAAVHLSCADARVGR